MEGGLTQRLDGAYKSSNSEALVQKEYETIHGEAAVILVICCVLVFVHRPLLSSSSGSLPSRCVANPVYVNISED